MAPQQTEAVAVAAPPPPAPISLTCAYDGEAVSAPAEALRWFGVLHRWREDALGSDDPLPPLPATAAPLTLLLALLQAAPPRAAAAAWLAEHAAAPGSLPLMHVLLVADALDAPRETIWASAEATALALLHEGRHDAEASATNQQRRFTWAA